MDGTEIEMSSCLLGLTLRVVSFLEGFSREDGRRMRKM